MAGKGNVDFAVTANNRSAMAAIGQVEKGVAGLSGKLTGPLAEGLAAGFSVYAIERAVSAVADFADELDKTAKRLQTTTENVQTLQRIASHSGTDLGIIEKGMNKIEAAAQDALGGDKSKQALFKKLGISTDDLQHLNKVDLLQKTAQGANKQGVADKDQTFASLFGEKLGPTIQSASDELARMSEIKDKMIASGEIMSDSDIAKLAEMKDSWKDLITNMEVKFAPVITTVLDAVKSFVNGTIQLVELFGTAIGAFSTIITTVKPWELIKALGENIVDSFQAIFSNLWELIRGKKSIGDVFDAIQEQQAKTVANALNKGFDSNAVDAAMQTVNEKLLEFATQDAKDAALKRAKEAAREAERAKVSGNVNRQGTVTPTPAGKVEEKLASVGNLAIGGTAGVDFQFRMARTNEKILDTLQKILEELRLGRRTSVFTKEEGYV